MSVDSLAEARLRIIDDDKDQTEEVPALEHASERITHVDVVVVIHPNPGPRPGPEAMPTPGASRLTRTNG